MSGATAPATLPDRLTGPAAAPPATAIRSVLVGYRPLGLSTAGTSTIIAGRATSYADRRRAAAERLSRAAQISQRLDAVVGGPSTNVAAVVPIDPDGTLRAAIRALIPLAHRVDDFDVTISLGPSHHWAARIRRGPDGVAAELVPGAGRGDQAGFADADTAASEAEIAAELAALLRAGKAGAR